MGTCACILQVCNKRNEKVEVKNKKNPCMIEEIVRGNEGESEQGHKRKWKNAEVN